MNRHEEKHEFLDTRTGKSFFLWGVTFEEALSRMCEADSELYKNGDIIVYPKTYQEFIYRNCD